jgi:hypothetical protein
MPKEKYTVEVIEPCLEIDEHLDLLEKGWSIQKWGWLFIISISVAGAIGLFGEGILSDRTVSAGNSKAAYQHFLRHEAETKIFIESSNHISSISLPEEYLKNFRIVRFIPEPLNNNTVNNTVKYNFLPAENHIVTVYLVSKGFGSVQGALTINEAENLQLNNFIYP